MHENEGDMTKICMSSISCNCGREYKKETCHPLKVTEGIER